MPDDPKGWHSRGYLPHFDSPEMIQHVVFRTFGSLPAQALEAMQSEADARRRAVDALLDRAARDGPLGDPASAAIVEDALLHFDGARCRMLAWCIMPNHVHVVVEQVEGWRLGDIVKSWKAFSAAAINRRHGAAGPVWAKDYFDRYVRNERHLAQTIGYVEENPVRSKLVAARQDWRFSSASHHRTASLQARSDGAGKGEPEGSRS